MSGIQIKDLWDNIVNYAYDVRKISIKLNIDKLGLEMWQPLKNNLSNYVFYNNGIVEKLEVKPLIYNFFNYNEGDSPEHEKSTAKLDDITLDNTIPADHFLVQQLRISKMNNDKLNVVKLMQIAYNIGQFTAERELNNSYDEKVLELYDQEELKNLESYLEDHKTYTIQSKQENKQTGHGHGRNKKNKKQKGGMELYKLNNF